MNELFNLKTKIYQRIEWVIQFKNKDLPNELNELFNLKTNGFTKRIEWVIQFKNKDLPNELNELFNLNIKIYQTNWMSYSI